MRLFLPMHQDDDGEWFRAAGGCVCPKCGYKYMVHPCEELYNIDHRLCDGSVVHL